MTTRDIVAVALMVCAFATLVTAHVTLALGLARRLPRWRAAVAFVVPPLAPWWGWQSRMRIRAGVWIAAAVAYAMARALGAG
jgi:hypothetical protein